MNALTIGVLAVFLAGSAIAKKPHYTIMPVKVVKISDGDTIHAEILNWKHRKAILKVLNSKKAKKFKKKRTLRVRMYRQDTPESAYKVNDITFAQETVVYKYGSPVLINWGKEAKKVLESLIQVGQKVYAKVGTPLTDRYGRLLAEIITTNRTNVNLHMVELGWSFPLFYTPLPPKSEINKYITAMVKARESGFGLWQNVSSIANNIEFANPVVAFPTDFRALVSNKKPKSYIGSLKNLKTGLPLKIYPFRCKKKIPPQLWFFVSTKDPLNSVTKYEFQFEYECPMYDL